MAQQLSTRSGKSTRSAAVAVKRLANGALHVECLDCGASETDYLFDGTVAEYRAIARHDHHCQR